jgi:hypothetical protein
VGLCLALYVKLSIYGARAQVTRGAPGTALSWEVGAGATGTYGAPGATLRWKARAGAQAARDAPGATLRREASAGAQATHDALGAALSREVGAGATRTRGTPGATLRREVGAGAQVTCGGPRAALSQEADTTPPPPLPPSSRPSRRCLYLAATLLGLPPPLHDFDDHDHLNLGIKGLSSVCGTHRFLLQSQHTCHHDATTMGGVSSLDSTFDLFSSLTVCGAPAVTAGDVRVYLIDYILCIISYHIW